MSTAADAGLVRAVGPLALAAAIVNCIIGATVFVMPGIVAKELGTRAPVVYVLCAAIMGLTTLCFAEAGSRVARTGGPYVYVEEAFGPAIAFPVGSLFWLSNVLAAGGIAAAVPDLAATAMPAFSNPVLRGAIIVALYAYLVTVNLIGVKETSRAVVILTILKLLPIVLFIALGLTHIDVRNFENGARSLDGLGRASITVVFAFSGMEVALAPSGEIRDPARTVPRALIGSLLFVTLVYVLVQAVAQGVMGAGLATSKASVAESGRMIAPWLYGLIVVGALPSMIGYLTSETLGSSRLLFAFARDGALPSPLGKVHERWRTPHVAIVVHALIATTLALTGTFQELLILSGIAVVLVYAVTAVAAWKLRRMGVRTERDPFVIPGGPLVPLLALVSLGWVAAQSTAKEFAMVGGVVALAGGYQWLTGQMRKSRRRLPAAL